MHFESSAELLRHVDSYLDRLVGNPPESVEDAKERIRYLLFLRDEMERFHFPNPRFAVMELIRILHEKLPKMEREDVIEIIPQLRLIKYTYDVRKWTYERARAAYIANRAALRIYELGILRDFLPFFPYGGEYRLMLEEVGGISYLVLRKILEEFGVREERLEVHIGEKISAKRVPAKRGVFRDKLSTIVLISTAIRRAWRETKEDIAREVQKIPNIQKIEEYERILRKYDPVVVQQNPRRLWDLLQELEDRGFLVNGEIDPEILEGLRRKRLVKYKALRDETIRILRSFLEEYYLLTPIRERKNRPLMPGLPWNYEDIPLLEKASKDLINLKESVERDLSIPAKYAGTAVLVVKRALDPKELADKYGIDLHRLQTYASMVREYLTSSSRLRRFFEELGEKRGDHKEKQ